MPVTVISVWVVVLMRCLLGRWSVGCSAAHESGDGLRGLAHLLGGGLVGLAGGIDDAVGDVVLEQAEAHRLQRLGDGADLGQDVDAVGVGVDHLLHATHLPLDAAQPLQVVVLAAGVSSHGTSSWWSTGYPSGVFPSVTNRRAPPSPAASGPWPARRR